MKFSGTKIEKVAQTVTSFAGIFFVNHTFNQAGLGSLIDKELGLRTSFGYQYSEIIRNYFNIFFCGGECAEDISHHLRKDLETIPGNRVPSADTLLRGIKELAVSNTKHLSSSGKSYQFNFNKKLNNLNIKSLLLTKQLESDKMYDFDYDNQFIVHEKQDAKRGYKKTKGYFPGVATIGDKIVYVENRDGNAHVKTDQAESLSNAYELLANNGIKINRSRMDAGSYCREIVKMVAKHSQKFYIRANKCDSLYESIREIKEWQTVEINYISYQVASIVFTRFESDKNYRLVIMRTKNSDGQTDLFTGDNFIYRCILTNDWESEEQAVIEYYNKRGESERTFDIQNNDFGWRHLPCSDMDANTVYLILMAMAKNFYNYLLRLVSKVFKDIPPTSRLKRFIFRFICTPGKWVFQGRQWKLRLYTDRPYERLCA